MSVTSKITSTYNRTFLGNNQISLTHACPCVIKSQVSASQFGSGKSYRQRSVAVFASEDEAEGIQMTWPASYSHVYEDIVDNLRPLLFLPEAQPEMKVSEVMTPNMYNASADDILSDIAIHFEKVSGLPVLGADGNVVGVISRKDLGEDLSKKVSDVMSTPAQCISARHRIADAAGIMLKYKIHRLPVVEDNKLVGMVTRTDIFTALGQTI